MDPRAKAEEDLRVIRSLMERATVYRAISAPTALVAGLLSIVAAVAIYWNNEVSLFFHRAIRGRQFAEIWIAVLVGRAGGQHFFYLARGTQNKSAFRFVRDETGAARNRAVPADSGGIHSLVFRDRLSWRSRSRTRRCLDRLVWAGAPLDRVIRAALACPARLGLSFVWCGDTGAKQSD